MSTAFWDTPYASRRLPVMAANMVSTSQPLAAQAGLRMLQQGGNAVDAALAAAITLTIVEPVMNGIGGDLFVQVWHNGQLHGLNASGRSPASWTHDHFAGLKEVPYGGWKTVTVPGQVAGWAELWQRFGSLPFATLFEPALHYAQEGFAVSPTIARQWALYSPKLAHEPGFAPAFLPSGRPPSAGDIWRFPDQARTLERIAQSQGRDFYEGELAQRIAAFAADTGGALTLNDLKAHTCDWVTPIHIPYRNEYALHELPPNGQGIAALMALGMLDTFDPPAENDWAARLHLGIEACKLAFADLHAHVADTPSMAPGLTGKLLDPDYLRQRARLIKPNRAGLPQAGRPHSGGTVYLAAADRHGTMVSFIQSNFHGFGSGCVVPGTGIALHSRGKGFSLDPGHPNSAGPGKRPLHTIIPGFITRHGRPLAALGVMGGTMQAQGHVQIMQHLVDYGCNPQAAICAPRFRVETDGRVMVEAGLPASALANLRELGHTIELHGPDSLEFGSAQIIMQLPHGQAYVAGSDPRRDGQAVGY
ncbi:MAG: gamma-glutamyltransferase family protein [Burkholderiaceae bacterium]